MTYTPINWQTGDTITAEKLNRCDNGWSVTSSTVTLINETFTTYLDGEDNVAELTVSDNITAATINVTYDSVSYNCTADGTMYGAPYGDYSDYPFTLYNDGFIICETSGTHTIKVEAAVASADTSTNFSTAVMAASPIFPIILGTTTWQQAHDAMEAGKLAFYITYVDGDSVTQFVASNTYYDENNDMYVIEAVGVSNSSAAIDTIYSFTSSGTLIRD